MSNIPQYYPSLDKNAMAEARAAGEISVENPPPYTEIDPTIAIVGGSSSHHSASAPLSISSTGGPTYGFVNTNREADKLLKKSRGKHNHHKHHKHHKRSNASTIPANDGPDGSTILPAVVTRGVPLASKSIDVVCPHCNTEIRTSIEKRPGLLAYLSGAVMACLCCFCGCCLIPCCIDECMEVKHTCPNCDGVVGKYRL